jgi:hypothetical protein
MASLLPFFGWAVLPNVGELLRIVNNGTGADTMHSMPRLSFKVSIMA